jgi:hypothetical protein
MQKMKTITSQHLPAVMPGMLGRLDPFSHARLTYPTSQLHNASRRHYSGINLILSTTERYQNLPLAR